MKTPVTRNAGSDKCTLGKELLHGVIETKRMILRPVRMSDRDFFLDLDSDPRVMKYLTDGEPSTEEEVDKFTIYAVELTKKHNNRFGFWIASDKNSGEFMGWFHFRPDKKNPDDLERVELGYRLKRKFWGKGFATEGSKSLIDLGFQQFGLKSVFHKL